MKIEQVIETEEGQVTFKGTLEGKELEYVITTGLHLLMLQGVLAQDTSNQNKSNEDLH